MVGANKRAPRVYRELKLNLGASPDNDCLQPNSPKEEPVKSIVGG